MPVFQRLGIWAMPCMLCYVAVGLSESIVNWLSLQGFQLGYALETPCNRLYELQQQGPTHGNDVVNWRGW